jgi:hypothetical protein
MPRSKKRRSVRERQAEQARAAQKKVEEKKLTPEQYARRRAFGWALVALAVAVGVSHWLAHIGFLYEDRPIWDLTIGYPMAGVLAVSGAIVLTRES